MDDDAATATGFGEAGGPVVLCGLGHVGSRVARLLRRLGVPVVAITQAARVERIHGAERDGVSVEVGDARDLEKLEEMGLARARALVAATNDDMTNLEIALDARSARPELPVVVRLFDQSLHEVEGALGLQRALAMSALAAPSFAAAALGENVLTTLRLEETLLVVGRLEGDAARRLADLPAGELAARGLAVLGGLADGGIPGEKPRVTVVAPREAWDRVAAPQAVPVVATAAPGDSFRAFLRALGQAPLPLRVVGATLLLLMVPSVLVFLFGLKLSFVDAVYFLVTTVTTTGYGDITLKDASWELKLYGCFVMLLGSAAVATLYSLLTDFVVTSRFAQLLGRGRVPRAGHVVVAGLGRLGYRVVEALRGAAVPVVVIDREPSGDFPEALKGDVPFVPGDARFPSTLERAGIKGATAILALTGDDAANLGIALAARRLRAATPENGKIRTVVRLFDGDLARKVHDGLELDAVLSGSELAAPAFAAAVVEKESRGAFVDANRLIVFSERRVGAADAGREPAALCGPGARVLFRGEQGRPLGVAGPEPLRHGERLLVARTLPLVG